MKFNFRKTFQKAVKNKPSKQKISTLTRKSWNTVQNWYEGKTKPCQKDIELLTEYFHSIGIPVEYDEA